MGHEWDTQWTSDPNVPTMQVYCGFVARRWMSDGCNVLHFPKKPRSSYQLEQACQERADFWRHRLPERSVLILLTQAAAA